MRYMKKTTVKAILTLGIFYFVFLGAEYLFDNMMAYATDSDGVVLAQSYILGISVIGFLLYAPLERLMTQTVQKIVRMAGMVVLIVSLFVICGHISYAVTMAAGLLAFLLLGYFGSAIHYMVTRVLDDRTILARTVGVAYAFGILLQFLNNNLIHSDWAEAVFLAIATLLMVLLFYNQMQETEDGVVVSEETNEPTDKRTLWIGLLFIGIVALITFVFATLDNAVTLTHASGSVDIGQWPRLLLACSGLLAGFLYDWNQRAYMNIIMYCVMMLSTICVVVISCGGPFLLGLLVFYLSAGFFAVYFATGFMELSYYSRLPKFWAGLGRAVNNFCAVITASAQLCYGGDRPYFVCTDQCADFCLSQSVASVAGREGTGTFTAGGDCRCLCFVCGGISFDGAGTGGYAMSVGVGWPDLGSCGAVVHVPGGALSPYW